MASASFRIGSIAAVAALTTSVSAQNFVTPDSYGWQRGDEATSYFEWDDFTSSSGPNAPDVAAMPSPLPAGWADPTCTETTGGSFVTSTGNIYSFGGILEFEIVTPAEPIEGGTTTVLLQTKTQGREVDPATIECNGEAPVDTEELYRLFLGPDGIGGGSLVVTLWRFEVPATGTSVITFVADGESLSLDSIAVDSFSSAATNCLADVNGDGEVTPTDFSAWIGAYNTNAPGCDQNGDGACTPTDFSAWINNYNNGC